MQIGVDGAGNVDLLVTPPDILEDVQFWKATKYVLALDFKASSSSMVLTETQAIREVIFMLLGLPTSISLLVSTEASTSCEVRLLSQYLLRQILQGFISLCDEPLIIREWLTRQESVPLLQTLQSDEKR